MWRFLLGQKGEKAKLDELEALKCPYDQLMKDSCTMYEMKRQRPRVSRVYVDEIIRPIFDVLANHQRAFPRRGKLMHACLILNQTEH